MSNALETSFNRVRKGCADEFRVWVPPQGHFQGQTRGYLNMHFFSTIQGKIYKKIYIFFLMSFFLNLSSPCISPITGMTMSTIEAE